MTILVYGAGNIGQLYAALLARSGQDVRILARGRRADEIRQHGIQLTHTTTGERLDCPVEPVDRLGTDNAYDLVLVALPKPNIREVLPLLAVNRHTPSVMFFGNNAAGPGAMVDALGRERVLLGFPGAAAVQRDGRLHYLITSAREQPTTVGELTGARSARIGAVVDALASAGFTTATCSRMDAWLKTHVAKIGPTAAALYLTGLDVARLARTRDALLLMLRGIREGFRVLDAAGIPITPSSRRLFQYLPEPLLLVIMRRMLTSDDMSIKIGHAGEARREMQMIAKEFQELATSSGIATPILDRLYLAMDPSVEPMVDGSHDLALRWA